MRSIEALWDSIKDRNFDETIDDATAGEIRRRCESFRNGDSPTNRDFSLNGKIATLGGIHEVRRTIARNWTIEELEDFLDAWTVETHEVKKSLMAATPPYSTADGVAEDRVWNFDAALKSTYDSALIAIGAKCYADCKRNNTFDALHLDDRPYYSQTLADVEKTLPPPLVGMLQAIGANTRRGAVAAEGNSRKFDALQGKINEMQAGVNLSAKNSAAAKRAAEQAEQTTAGLPAAIAEAKAEAAGAKVAAEGAWAAAEKAAKKPTTVVNAQPGATVTVVKPPRTDAGETHGKTARGWRTQADMATDFSKSAKKIGGKWYGKITEATVKDWENRYPNETKRERKSGYHAGLRNDPNPTPEIKQAYYEAAANWNGYWKKHNAAFLAWLKANPNGDHATFLKTWERPGKTVRRNDTDKTMRYGADTSFSDSLDSGDFDNET